MAVQIVLKNSSIEDKRPSASQLTNGEISLNYNENGAFLCCKDTDGNLQQVGGVKIDEDAPDAPVKQTQWFKPSTLTLSVFDGDKWLPIASGGGGGGGGDIIQIIGNDGIDADTVAGIVTLDIELAGGDDGLEFKSSKLSATLASATDLGSVKVGDNITVAAGTISVSKADTSTFGVVKVGDGLGIAGDGSLFADVPKTTTYRGSCNLNNSPTGQLNPDPALKGDAYINSAETASIEPDWTPLTGTAEIGDLVIFDGTEWQLIPIGNGTAPVTSVNTKTGDVVLDYTDVGAASAAQGALADTALQSGDNISELSNDEGYITAADVAAPPVTSVNAKVGDVVLAASDVGAVAPGDDVSGLNNDAGYITAGDIPAPIPAPVQSVNSKTGDVVLNAIDVGALAPGDDVSELNNDAGYITAAGVHWDRASGTLSPKVATDDVHIGNSKIQLLDTGEATFSEGKTRLTTYGGLEMTTTQSVNTANISIGQSGGNRVFRMNGDGTVGIGGVLEGGGGATFDPNIKLNSSDGSGEFIGDVTSFSFKTPNYSSGGPGARLTSGNSTASCNLIHADTATGTNTAFGSYKDNDLTFSTTVDGEIRTKSKVLFNASSNNDYTPGKKWNDIRWELPYSDNIRGMYSVFAARETDTKGDQRAELHFASRRDNFSTYESHIKFNATGTIILGELSNGIQFAGPKTSSGDNLSKRLEDYEMGTYQVKFRGTGTAGTIVYNENNGFYTRVGQLVNVWGSFKVSSITVTPTNSVWLHSSPYTVSDRYSSTTGLTAHVLGYAAAGALDTGNISDPSAFSLVRSSTGLGFWLMYQRANAVTPVSVNAVKAGAYLRFCASYITDD